MRAHNSNSVRLKDVREVDLGTRSGSALIEAFRESHLAVARMIAAGMPDHMIRRRTGYTQRRLTLMKQTPAFQQLIEDYRESVMEKINGDTDSFAELSIGNMVAAERQIADHIAEADEKGELLPIATLHRVVSDRADRFGYSKRVTQTNIDVDIAAIMDRAIARSATVRQIEHQPSPNPLATAATQADVLVGEEQPVPSRAAAAPPPQPPSRLIKPKLLRRL